jgi:hypothetical protein
MNADQIVKEYNDLAEAGRLFVRTVNRREKVVWTKVRRVSSMKEGGRLLAWTAVSPVCTEVANFEIR